MLRSGKSSELHEQQPKMNTKIISERNIINSDNNRPSVIKCEPIEIVDSEVSFNYNAKNTNDEFNTSKRNNNNNINNNSIQIVDEDISFNFNTFNSKTEPIEVVDDEISFNFTKQKRQQQQNLVDWLSTMVIIYQDLLIFDIKSEPKDDYEAHCCTGNGCCEIQEVKMLGTKKRTGKMEFRKKPAKWKYGIY